MLEVLKHLNYCGLANSRLVSKKFCNLIRTHRHTLARLYVSRISMECSHACFDELFHDCYAIVFDNDLFDEAYEKWVIRNRYSKRLPLDAQIAVKQSKQYDRDLFKFSACADYKDPRKDRTTVLSAHQTNVFSARADLHDENWPVFQHFIQLLSDPFIHIARLNLAPQDYDSNLLAFALNPNRDHTQCKESTINLEAPKYSMCCSNSRISVNPNLVSVAVKTDPKRLQCEELLLMSDCINNRVNNHVNTKKLVDWIKNHMVCKRFRIWHHMCPIERDHYDEELFDFIVTGAQCTSKFTVRYYDLSGVVVNVVQKFMDFKSCDECQFVLSVKNKQVPENQSARVLKLKYAKFIVKEEKCANRTAQVYEFVNADIKKKLLLTVQVFDVDFNYYKLESYFVLTIENL